MSINNIIWWQKNNLSKSMSIELLNVMNPFNLIDLIYSSFNIEVQSISNKNGIKISVN